ncbi:MAG: 5'-nucleotidase C-terminal domain-containing protein [Bacteroidota bacterium]
MPRLLPLGLALCVALALPARAQTSLTILHNSDGESQLINLGSGLEDFGGVACFATLADQLRAEAALSTDGAVLISSGDTFLAGPEFTASLENGVPYFDAVALDLIGYDAVTIGNHEFDFGPEVLANFITSFGAGPNPPFLSANLDVSAEPSLDALEQAGRIAASTVVTVNGTSVGIIGATTTSLPFISTPGDVVVMEDVAAAVQVEVTALQGQGVEIIILSSHLQSINEELALVPLLSGVDVVIAGGELLANAGDLLIPGDEGEVFGAYPQTATDADGTSVPVVGTSGDYAYLGRLVVDFDAAGDLVSVGTQSGPVRVACGTQPDAVTPDPAVQAQAVDPVIDFVADLAATVIGTSEVPLNGVRGDVRTEETNLGDLIADALLWQADQLNEAFDAPQPDVALQNGGGIRNDNVLAAGPISELATFDILPFTNFVTIVEDVGAAQFKEILENAVSQVEDVNGRFAQSGGFFFAWDTAGTAQELDADGNVVTPGTRVQDVQLADGTVLVDEGVVAEGAPSLNVATADFLARGGDQYPFRDNAFTLLGVTYQQALSNYIQDALGGTVAQADYPVGGPGRIYETTTFTVLATPSTTSVPASGGQVSSLVEVAQSDDTTRRVEAWTVVERPDGTTFVERHLEPPFPVAPTAARMRTLMNQVPAGFAPGTYTVTVNVGRFPAVEAASDQFTFVKEGAALAGGSGDAAEAGAARSSASLPAAFALTGTYPNPTSSRATVGFDVPQAEAVRVAVYDVLGRQVAVLVDETVEAGRHTAALDASALAGGVYIVRLEAGAFVASGRLVVTK